MSTLWSPDGAGNAGGAAAEHTVSFASVSGGIGIVPAAFGALTGTGCAALEVIAADDDATEELDRDLNMAYNKEDNLVYAHSEA